LAIPGHIFFEQPDLDTYIVQLIARSQLEHHVHVLVLRAQKREQSGESATGSCTSFEYKAVVQWTEAAQMCDLPGTDHSRRTTSRHTETAVLQP
jgi:hypothetical protein